MTSRLILHIGLPKTGSSAIQSFLSGNARRLADRGLQTERPSGVSGLDLAVAFSDRQNALADSLGVRSEADREDLQTRALSGLVRTEQDQLLSSEHLAGMLRTPAEVGRLADALHTRFEQVLIIAVLRRADYWLPSAYTEAVRSGRDVRLRAPFVERRRHLLDHFRLLQRWAGAFGDDAVRLKPFLEEDKTDPGTIGFRFLEATGIAILDPGGWTIPERLVRPGLSATGVEMLRRIGPVLGVDRMSSADRGRLIALLADRHPGPGMALTPAAQKALAERDLIRTGIEHSVQAHGQDWAAWRDAPPAPVRRRPRVSEAELEQTLAAVRRAGLGGTPSLPGAVARIARGLAARVGRRV